MARTTPTSLVLDDDIKAYITAWSQYLAQKRAGSPVSRTAVIRSWARLVPLPKENTSLAQAVRDAYDDCFGDEE